MADEADRASLDSEKLEEADIARIRKLAAEMPTGVPGDCYLCGEPSPRLVRAACARCRDKHGLP